MPPRTLMCLSVVSWLTSPHRDRHSNKQLSFSECMCWEGREQGVFPIGVESDGSELMQPCLPEYISAPQPCLPEYISAPQHISELAAQPTFWKRSPLLRVAHSLLGPSSYSHFPPGSLVLGWHGVGAVGGGPFRSAPGASEATGLEQG